MFDLGRCGLPQAFVGTAFGQTVNAHIGQRAGVGFVGFVQIVRTDVCRHTGG